MSSPLSSSPLPAPPPGPFPSSSTPTSPPLPPPALAIPCSSSSPLPVVTSTHAGTRAASSPPSPPPASPSPLPRASARLPNAPRASASRFPRPPSNPSKGYAAADPGGPPARYDAKPQPAAKAQPLAKTPPPERRAGSPAYTPGGGSGQCSSGGSGRGPRRFAEKRSWSAASDLALVELVAAFGGPDNSIKNRFWSFQRSRVRDGEPLLSPRGASPYSPKNSRANSQANSRANSPAGFGAKSPMGFGAARRLSTTPVPMPHAPGEDEVVYQNLHGP
ncbi:hypothetical protein TeGR_g4217 [Tetraparma gracilis]|uniref:Uncharacterized protein n=1 Tax=Tetraparma gracilis TaxID=2962635 RepID=A0ABQ6N138_9STRA|nr:hypothetical protein TeGR_g4217 [Tetraparma gracilis]